jgi:hypothetical protein
VFVVDRQGRLQGSWPGRLTVETATEIAAKFLAH